MMVYLLPIKMCSRIFFFYFYVYHKGTTAIQSDNESEDSTEICDSESEDEVEDDTGTKGLVSF